MLDVTHLIGFAAGRELVETVVGDAVGTNSGSYTTRTSAGRDGTTAQDAATAARSGVADPTRWVVDFGAGNEKVISGVEYWGPTDQDLNNGNGGTVTPLLRGSNSDSTGATGTTIGTIAPYTTGVADNKSTLSNANDVAYRYVTLEITYSVTGSGGHGLAEVRFWEWL
jgi:hypothetical protein